MALDLKADILYQYATDVAMWQMDRIECHMKRHPGRLSHLHRRPAAGG